MRRVTRDMQPLELRADVVPSTLDPERRTVQVVWTTGARVLRGFWDPYWEELSLDPKHVRMDRLNSGSAPMLNSHNSDDLSDVIGVVESASLQKTKGIATVRFALAEDDPVADQIFRKVKDGIIKNVSVGYRVHTLEKVESGEGKTPVYRATDWEPYEISPVAIGADAAATVRSEGAVTNPCVFIEERTMDPEETPTPTPTPKTKESPAVAATRAASEARAADAASRAEERAAAAEDAIAKERTRIAEIRKLARQARLGDTWAQTLIEAGTPVVEARQAAFEQIVETDKDFPAGGGHIRIGAGDDQRDKWIRGTSAWMLQRSGYGDVVRRGKEAMPNHPAFKDLELDPGEFRGMLPIELARQWLERQNVDTRGLDPMRMVGMAFTHVRSGSAFQTTSDFSVMLENVLSKVLLGAYATQENTWTRFCASKELKDFRTSNQYRTGSIPGLSVINEHGEYTTGAIPDAAKYPLITGRLGKKFSLSREVIVNDDMGALLQLAEGFGQSAQRTIETSVYALLALNAGLGPTQADAQPFFHANRANVSTGAALTVAALDADRVVLRAQKDPNVLDFLDLRPAVLLVPDSLYGQANVINDAQYDTDKIANGRQQEPNRVRGLFRDVVGTPRLTGTRRYVFAQTMDAIVVAFLEGHGKAPIVETMNGWNIDGVEWKVTLYAKAQMGDPKSALTNAGV